MMTMLLTKTKELVTKKLKKTKKIQMVTQTMKTLNLGINFEKKSSMIWIHFGRNRWKKIYVRVCRRMMLRLKLEAFYSLLPQKRTDTLLQYLRWYHDLKTDQVHKKVMKTLRSIMEDDETEYTQAAEAVVLESTCWTVCLTWDIFLKTHRLRTTT